MNSFDVFVIKGFTVYILVFVLYALFQIYINHSIRALAPTYKKEALYNGKNVDNDKK